MYGDVPVAVGLEPDRGSDRNASEHHGFALFETVDIEAVSCEHGARGRGEAFEGNKVCGVGDFGGMSIARDKKAAPAGCCYGTAFVGVFGIGIECVA